MRQSNRPSRFLKYVLRSNAIFSFLSGIAVAVFSTSLAELMGLTSAMILNYMGLILCGFAIYVWIYATRQTWTHVRMIIFQDLLWVMGSITLIFTNPFDITAEGLWIIAIIAMVVLDFALLQVWGVRRIR